jgi:hypothetical protein
VTPKGQNECYAYFSVAGTFEPAEITKRVGIAPTQSRREGEMVLRTQIPRKCSRWQLHSRLDKSASLEAHVSDVLAQLDANPRSFEQLSSEFGGVMELVGYFYDYYPGLHFEREIVTRLAQYSLSVDCDFYFRSEEEEEVS